MMQGAMEAAQVDAHMEAALAAESARLG